MPLIDAFEQYLNSLSVEVRFKELIDPFLVLAFTLSFFFASLSLNIKFGSSVKFLLSELILLSVLSFSFSLALSEFSFVFVELKLASSHMVAKGALFKPVFRFDAA